MVLNFKYSESTVQPSAIEMCKKSVFVRQNITESTRTDESGNTVTYWAYEEASLTPEEFNEYVQYISASNALKGVNDSGNILRILSGQELSDNNQMIVMEAIADLYDVITMLM